MTAQIPHRLGIILIDTEDYLRAVSENWSFYPIKKRNTIYVQLCRWDSVKKRQDKRSLHQLVLNGNGQMICHLNGNGLDCRKENLAFGTHHQNGSSFRTKLKSAASRFRGVHINNGRGKQWSVQFWDKGTTVYLGRFDNETEAAMAYDTEAKKRFGKFAHLNFP